MNGLVSGTTVVGAVWADEDGYFSIGVLPDQQGKGLARRLMLEWIDYAKRLHLERIYMEPIHDAIKHLARELGFEKFHNTQLQLYFGDEVDAAEASPDLKLWSGQGEESRLWYMQGKFYDVGTNPHTAWLRDFLGEKYDTDRYEDLAAYGMLKREFFKDYPQFVRISYDENTASFEA
jgi:ribosomal protein S18 acetylase RimI-like enzyme